MRLLTHNYLQSNVKGTKNGYPLRIRPTKITWDEESPVDIHRIEQLLRKIDYSALEQAVKDIQEYCQSVKTDVNSHPLEGGGTTPILPPTLPEHFPMPIDDYDDNTEKEEKKRAYRQLHKVLFDFHVEEGKLVCPGTGREFTIKQGIPNMILHEDEI